jgi:phosphoribosylanthranilate isomerase
MSGVKVKICGVTDPDNALLAAEWGADYLGLNFYPGSPRYVDVARAREIAAAVREARGARGRAELVGVFVNRPAAEVEEIAAAVGLDLVQWSGDEGAADIAPFAARSIKVFRTGGNPGEAALAPYADVWGVMFDAPHGTLYGGTGASWPYESIAMVAGVSGGAGVAARRRVFLAGGLGPGNAARAIAAGRPFAIDVCSRVESSPGVKDPELLRRLFEEVRNGEDGEEQATA